MNSASGAGIIRSNLIRSFAKDTLTHWFWQDLLVFVSWAFSASLLSSWRPMRQMVVQAGCCLQKNCLAQVLVHASHGSIGQLKALVRNKIQSLPRRYFCLIVPSILCKRGPGDKRISEFGGPDRRERIYKSTMK